MSYIFLANYDIISIVLVRTIKEGAVWTKFYLDPDYIVSSL